MKPCVLITGACGGMGKATVRTLRDGGFRVFALDKVVCEADEDIIPIKADITNEESVQAAKNSIDIAVKAHKEQLEYIRAQRNARRRKFKNEQSEQGK